MPRLHVPVVIEPFAVGVGGRVDDDNVVFSFSTFDGFVDEFNTVPSDVFMLWAVEAVEFEIPLSPLKVVFGKINRRRG